MTDDDFEAGLRQSLGDAVPVPPEAPDRADGARSHQRRARRVKAAVAVSAVAVVATAVVVVPSVLASDSGSQVAAPGPTGRDSTKLPVNDPVPCGDRATPREKATGAEVPPGAVLARLCARSGPVSWSPPVDPLVTDVPQLVERINALPKTSPNPCPMALQPAYTLRLQYPDGRVFDVMGTTGGCDLVTFGGSLRTGATSLLQDFLGSLHEQRLQQAPSGLGRQPACLVGGDVLGRQTVLVDGQEPALVGARFCTYLFPSQADPMGAGTLAPDQVSTLNEDIASHATRVPIHNEAERHCRVTFGPSFGTMIAGVDKWGDRVTLTSGCGGIYTFIDRSGRWFWSPTARTARMLSSVLVPIRHPKGRVIGQLTAVGGPAGVPNRGLPGTVELRGGDQGWIVVHVGRDGTFDEAVTPGRYAVVGHSPLYQDNSAPCLAGTRMVTVRPHATTHLTVTCQEK